MKHYTIPLQYAMRTLSARTALTVAGQRASVDAGCFGEDDLMLVGSLDAPYFLPSGSAWDCTASSFPIPSPTMTGRA